MTFETFRKFDDYILERLISSEPTCFGGVVNVTRFRVVVEEIPEPKEAIQARLQKLWDESDNMHHMKPLQREAERLGVEINRDTWGKKRRQF